MSDVSLYMDDTTAPPPPTSYWQRRCEAAEALIEAIAIGAQDRVELGALKAWQEIRDQKPRNNRDIG